MRPTIALQSVVFPMPLRPTTESTPRSRLSETPWSACELAVIDLQVLNLQDRLRLLRR